MGRGVLPSESQIELQLLDYLNRVRKFEAWKNTSTGYYDAGRKCFRRQSNPYCRNGVADILCVIPVQFSHMSTPIGITVYFEVKSPRGVQSESQKEFERVLRASGGYYYLVRSIEELELALDDFEASLTDPSR